MSAVAAVGPGSVADPSVRLRNAAEAFEGLLVQTLLRRMREAHLEHGLFGDGAGSSVYEGLFDQHLAEALSRESPFGIADMLEHQWSGDGDAAERALRRLDALRATEAYIGAAVPQVPGEAADE